MSRFFFFFLLISLVLGLYGPKSDVILLTKKNFFEVLTSTNIWLVEFFAPWCGHCKRLAPEWEKAATNLKGIVPVAAVDCDNEKELCGMFQVQGFPTIKLFPSETSENPYQKGMPWKTPTDYQYQRTAAAIANFALTSLPSFVKTLTQKNFDEFLAQNGEIPKAVLFSDKAKISNIYKSLSATFKNRIDFGQVDKSQKELVKKYDVKAFPTLVVLQKDETHPYTGDIKPEQLTKFLNTFAPKPKTFKPEQAPKEKKTEEKKVEEEKPAVVYHLSSNEDFERECLSNNFFCGIAFLPTPQAPPLEEGQDVTEHEAMTKEIETQHKAYQDVLLKLAEENKRNVRIMWIDGANFYPFAEDFNLRSGFPAFVVFSPKKLVYSPFVGPFDNDHLGTFVRKVLSGRSASLIPFQKAPVVRPLV